MRQIFELIVEFISSFLNSSKEEPVELDRRDVLLKQLGDVMNHENTEIEIFSSVHFNSREENEIGSVIIHDVSLDPNKRLKTFDGTLEYFGDREMEHEASAHYFVDKDRVIRMVNDSNRAWHAGKSLLNGRFDVNDFSVGIELINYNAYGEEDFTDFQYGWAAWKTRMLMDEYKFNFSWVSTHEIIRANYRAAAEKAGGNVPAIKEDPHQFDWNRFSLMVLGAKELSKMVNV